MPTARVLRVGAAAVVLVLSAISAAPKLTPSDARNHVGETATVCGVASASHASTVRGQPTFLNLDRPYPNQIFTAVIWGSERARFGKPEETYANKRICVTGRIEEYKSKPEIIVRSPSQVATH